MTGFGVICPLQDSAAEDLSFYENVEELTADFRHQLGLLPVGSC